MTLAALAAFLTATRAETQPLRLRPPSVTSTGVGLGVDVEGLVTDYVRLDASADWKNWEPVDLLPNGVGPIEFVDPDAPLAPQRFYRAVGVDARAGVTGWSAPRLQPGGRLTIFGEQFARGRLGDHIVLIDGKPAAVLAATGARLLVQVPADATTGEVIVVTPDGARLISESLTITSDVRVEWSLPVGIRREGFEVIGAFGPATPGEAGGLVVQARVGRPQVIFAIPTEAASVTFLASISEGAAAPIVFGAPSTAEALVFMHPWFQTQDHAVAAKNIAAIRSDSKVAALATVIGDEWRAGGDPFARQALPAAYRDAVVSVSRSLAAGDGARTLRPLPASPRLASAVGLTWELDSSFVRFHSGAELRDKGGKSLSVGVSPEPGNPVDWVVVAHEVDVEAAFPRGQEDLLRVYQRPLPLGLDPAVNRGYPLRPGYERRRFVNAQLFSSNLHLMSQIIGRAGEWAKGWVWGEKGPELFEFEDRDAVYVIRAVGPALAVGSGDVSAAEATFLEQNSEGLGSIRVSASAINLLAGALDLLGGSFDLADELEKLERTAVQEGLMALAVSAAKEAPKWQNLEDVLAAVLSLSSEAANFIATKAAEKGIESAARKTAASYAKAAGLASAALTALDLIGTAGEVLERGSGFLRTTPMETTFVVVGDPFRLEIVSVTPAGGAPGDILSVVIRKARFDAQTQGGDRIFITSTNGADPFLAPAKVIGVPTNLPSGRQLLQVRLPAALAARPDGLHALHVRAQGRSGQTTFQLVAQPSIASVLPPEGFAAVEDFMGQPFAGSAIRIRGLGFGPDDEMLFGGLVSTNKAGGSGDVVARVPRGASSGPVIVRRQVPTNEVREATGPSFAVLGPPRILAVSPVAGPVGTRMALTVENVGSIDALQATYAMVSVGSQLLAPLRRGHVLEVVIPVDVLPGPVEVVLFTPAGKAATSFQVEPGRAPGAEITVGTIAGCEGPTVSPVTLASALAIAAGSRLPADDEDRQRILREGVVEEVEVDVLCQWEEGDYVHPDLGYYAEPGSVTPRPDLRTRWPVGAANADRIVVTEGTGELSGDFEFAGSYDSLHLDSLSGSLRLSGTNNTFTVRSFRGTRLIIEGSHNLVTGTFELIEGITVRGHQNQLSGEVKGSKTDGVLVQGDLNEIRVSAIDNLRNGVVIDGGRWNRVVATTGRNGGHGVILENGATGNEVSVGSGRPFGDGVEAGTGNAGHGVLVASGSRNNFIRGVSPVGGNGGDGVRLEGDGIEDNLLEILDAVGNGGNGFTIGPGAVGTLIPVIVARRNRGDGVHVEGARATVAGSIRSGFNLGSGVVIRGVSDGTTELGSLQLNGNLDAGLLLAGVTRQLSLEATIQSGAIGLKCDGSGVASNLVVAVVRGCTSHGAVIDGGQNNRFWIQVNECGGHGVLARGTATNEFEVDADQNAGDGLRLERSRNDVVSGRFKRNQNGVVLADGTRDDTLHALQSNANRAHGVHITGAETRGNSVSAVSMGSPIADEPEGNLGDGLRIDDGASANVIGGPSRDVFSSGNATAGLRVSGPATVGNRILNAVLSSAAAGRQQPVGILVEDRAVATVIGGPETGEAVLVAGNLDGIVVRTGARDTSILNCEVRGHANAGIRVVDAFENGIGGAGGPFVLPIVPGPDGLIPPVTWGNRIHNNQIGIEIVGALSRNNAVRGNTVAENQAGIVLAEAMGTRLEENVILANALVGLESSGTRGTRIGGNTISDNAGPGVRLVAGTTFTEVIHNRVQGNLVGVQIVGATTRQNDLSANFISGNAGTGIALVDGSNDGIEAPRIETWSSQSVTGTTDAPDGSRVEVFADPTPDYDEGLRWVGMGYAARGRYQVRLLNTIRPDEVGRLFALNATVTDLKGNTSEFGGTVGGDRTFRCLYTSTRDGNAELYLAQGLLAAPIRLTASPAEDTWPALSPDGTRVAFVSTREGNADIYLMTLTGTNPVVRLTWDPSLDTEPTWSSDGSGLAFISARSGSAQVYRMTADGSNLTRLTTGPWNDRSPSFSPDGSQLVVASDRSGDWDLWILNADGSGARSVAPQSAADTEPHWSPDGQRIAFVSDRDGNDEIYTVRIDGSDLRRLTENPASDRNPAWLPEDEGIAFSSNRDEGFEVYWVSVTGGIPERLTLSAGDNTQPAASR
ncbi:MAG: PD40 domain-containing protein [Verrucomicrobiales bacterium]|nr:PD40 domain-containing protein [Verrucomicrobiales bacterium]